MSLRIGLLCPDVPGHLNPLTTLGHELGNRGHAVTLIGSAAAEDYARRQNLDFEPIGLESGLEDQLKTELAKLGDCSQFSSMLQTGKCFGLHSRMILSDLPALLDRKPLDAMIIDQLTPAGYAVATKNDLPVVIASNALAAYWDPALPPPPLNWAYRDDVVGRMRNRIARSLIPRLYFWLAGSRDSGVDPLKLVFEKNNGVAQIAQQPGFFDFPRSSLPDNFFYTAPWHRVDRDDKVADFPWHRLDGRPLIYASMGTLQNRLAHVFRAIFEVAGELDYQVVVSRGGGSLTCPGGLPDNVIVVDQAPQLRLLQTASLAITHAGLNTVLECLSCGVPMLCLPVTNDQPGVAQRVQWLGLGKVLPAKRVNAERLRQLIREMINDDQIRRNVLSRQAELSSVDGPGLAADIVETALHNPAQLMSMSSGWQKNLT